MSGDSRWSLIPHVSWIYSRLSLLVHHQGHPPLLNRAGSADKTPTRREWVSVHTLAFRSDRRAGTRAGVRPGGCHTQLEKRRRFTALNPDQTSRLYRYFLFYLKHNNNIKIKALELLLQLKENDWFNPPENQDGISHVRRIEIPGNIKQFGKAAIMSQKAKCFRVTTV